MVDGIGKGGPKIPPTTTGPAAGKPKVQETGRTFSVEKTEVQKPGGPTHVAPAASVPPIEQLKSGQIDVNGYLDLKVHEATSHLQGLTPVQLDAIKSMLRDQLASDPALSDLFKQATGHAPPAQDD